MRPAGVFARYINALGFETRVGQRKILLVNKGDRTFDYSVAGDMGARVEVVDQTTGFQPPKSSTLSGEQFTLRGLGVAVVTLPK